MYLPTFGALLKTLTICLVLVLGNVGESNGLRSHVKHSKFSHHGNKHNKFGFFERRSKFKFSGQSNINYPKNNPFTYSPPNPSTSLANPSTNSYTPTSPSNPSMKPPTPSFSHPIRAPTTSISPSSIVTPNYSPIPYPSINNSFPPINPPTYTFTPSSSPNYSPISYPSINNSFPLINPPTYTFTPSSTPSTTTNPIIEPSSPPLNPDISTSPPPMIPINPSNSPLISPSPTINPPLSPSNNVLSPSISPTNLPTSHSNPPLISFNPSSPLTSPSNSPFYPSIPSISSPTPSSQNIDPPLSSFSPTLSPSINPIHPSNPPIDPPLPSHIIAPINHFPPSISPLSPSHTIQPSTSPPLNPPTNSFSPSISPNQNLSPHIPQITPSSPHSNPPINILSPSPSPSSPTNPPHPHVDPPTSISSPSLNPPLVSPSSPPDTNSPDTSIGLRVGFYKGLCPTKNVDIEASITAKVQEHFRKDSTLLPAILRMQFHDCFVHGCDASILIDGPTSEKNSGPNLSVRGYEFIDDLKDIAEAKCSDVVSCADIIAIATKELIKLGGGPEYSVQTGRRDGVISQADDVRLPSPFGSVTRSILAFSEKSFTAQEMVALFGAHTVGIAQCIFFQDRLYEGTSQFDPNMDPNLRRQLISTCPEGNIANNFTSLDQNPQSANIFDNSFFDQILKQRGILEIDQELARDPQTRDFVLQFARNPTLFNAKFASAMVKLQALEVLLGDQGQIRKVCSKVN